MLVDVVLVQELDRGSAANQPSFRQLILDVDHAVAELLLLEALRLNIIQDIVNVDEARGWLDLNALIELESGRHGRIVVDGAVFDIR